MTKRRSTVCRMKARDDREYGHRLRIVRLTLGLTEAEAATAHGITLRTYRRWEAGKPQGGNSTMAMTRFAKTYNISFEWLIAGNCINLKPHLSRNTAGKLAILPVVTTAQKIERAVFFARLAAVQS